jgi:hypothetical protein
MVEILRLAPSVFDGDELYDSSEPRVISAKPQECAVDLMEMVDGLSARDGAIALDFCGVRGLTSIRQEGAKAALECPNESCSVELVLENQGGTINASANPGCSET